MKNFPNYFKGEQAKKVCHVILDGEVDGKYPLQKGAKGLFEEDGYIVAFDNTTCDCWVEQFDNEDEALKWLI